MFTGIITDIGTVEAVELRGDLWARIATGYDTTGIDLGASISHNGMCLTVIKCHPHAYEVEISAESIAKTNIQSGRKTWTKGTKINLERALKIGDELGGHIVTGHIDGTAEVINITTSGDSQIVTFNAPDHLAKYIAPKGSVTLDGTSLTVNNVSGTEFDINLISHTQQVTIWGDVQKGDLVNLEIDTLARYVERLNSFTGAKTPTFQSKETEYKLA